MYGYHPVTLFSWVSRHSQDAFLVCKTYSFKTLLFVYHITQRSGLVCGCFNGGPGKISWIGCVVVTTVIPIVITVIILLTRDNGSRYNNFFRSPRGETNEGNRGCTARIVGRYLSSSSLLLAGIYIRFSNGHARLSGLVVGEDNICVVRIGACHNELFNNTSSCR